MILAAVRQRLARTPLALRALLVAALASGSMGGAAVLGMMVLHHYWSERDTAETESFLLAATRGDIQEFLQSERPSGRPEGLLERADALCWVGLVDGQGRCTELLRRTAMTTDEIARQIPPGAQASGTAPLAVGGLLSERFELLLLPQPGAAGTLAAVVDRSHLSARAAFPTLALLLCCLGGAGGVLAALIVWRQWVYRPMRGVARRAAAARANPGRHEIGDDVPAELEDLAAAVGELGREINHWRAEAAYLRYSVETTVDQRTRHAAAAAQRAEREAETDPLTRLANRRALERALPRIFAEHVARNEELCLLAIDVDRFKALNDTLGHQAGDNLLKFLGELIRSTIRKEVDLGVRLGGDEFVIVMPGTAANDALNAGRRLAALFMQRARTLGPIEPPPALSIGLVARRQHGVTTWEELLQRADAAMYHAKRGRAGIATAREAASRPVGKSASRK